MSNYIFSNTVTDKNQVTPSVAMIYDATLSGYRPARHFELSKTQASNATVYTGLSSNAVAVRVLAANDRRIGYKLFSEAPSELSIKEGAGASHTNKSFRLTSGVLYESAADICYTGDVTALWYGSTSGLYYATEYTY